MVLSKIKRCSFYTIMSYMLLMLTACDKCSTNKLSVSPAQLTFEANETTPQLVAITTDAPEWNAVSSHSTWLQFSEQSTSLSVTVTEYTDTSGPRTGSITVNAGNAPATVIEVTQNAKHITSLNPLTLNFEWNDTNEKKTTVTTTSTKGWDFELPSAVNWLTCTKNGNELVVKPSSNNTGTSERKAEITIKGGSSDAVKLTVTQARSPFMTLSPSTNVSWSASATSRVTNITSNTNWTVSSSASSWLTVTPSSGSNNGSVTVRASANSDAASRNGIITFKATGVSDQTFTVAQAGNVYLRVSTNDMTLTSSSATTRNFNIESNVNWTVSRGSYSWISVSPASGSNNRTGVTVSISANTSTSSRTGYVTVSGPSGSGLSEEIRVYQPGAVPTTAQVRFKKSVYTADIPQLGIYSSGGSSLATYNFGASTGTSGYFNITSGYHDLRFYNYGWKSVMNFTFIAGIKYTYELESLSGNTASFRVYAEDFMTGQQNNTIQKPESLPPPTTITIPINVNR